MLFSLRCNVWYRGAADDNTPTFGFGVSFNANDFVQVVEVCAFLSGVHGFVETPLSSAPHVLVLSLPAG